MLHVLHILFRIGEWFYSIWILLNFGYDLSEKRKQKRDGLSDRRPSKKRDEYSNATEQCPESFHEMYSELKILLYAVLLLLIILGSAFFEVFCG